MSEYGTCHRSRIQNRLVRYSGVRERLPHFELLYWDATAAPYLRELRTDVYDASDRLCGAPPLARPALGGIANFQELIS